MSESGKTNVRVNETLHRRLKIECAKRGKHIQEATEEALEVWIKSKPLAYKKELQAA